MGLVTAAVVAAGVTFVAGIAVAHRHRPRLSTDSVHAHPKDAGAGAVSAATNRAVDKQLVRFASSVTTGTTGVILSSLLALTQSIEVINGHLLTDAIAKIGSGPSAPGLVTVSNHQSTFDDPGVIAAISPLVVMATPSKFRVGLCSQELCFQNPTFATAMGLTNVVPVQRGGSIHQKAIADLTSAAGAGRWVHLFPEGRIWQEAGEPLRDVAGSWCTPGGRKGVPWTKLGPFKWGVGKVIANAAKPPIVLPIYHLGMAQMMPQGPDNELLTSYLVSGTRVTVLIGAPVPYDDVITAYHSAASARAAARACSGGVSGAMPPPHMFSHLSGDDVIVPLQVHPGGVVVPAYKEVPLRIKPSDHESLSPSEARIEEAFRLQLYADVTARVHDTMLGMEGQARARRALDPQLKAIDDFMK